MGIAIFEMHPIFDKVKDTAEICKKKDGYVIKRK